MNTQAIIQTLNQSLSRSRTSDILILVRRTLFGISKNNVVVLSFLKLSIIKSFSSQFIRIETFQSNFVYLGYNGLNFKFLLKSAHYRLISFTLKLLTSIKRTYSMNTRFTFIKYNLWGIHFRNNYSYLS